MSVACRHLIELLSPDQMDQDLVGQVFCLPSGLLTGHSSDGADRANPILQMEFPDSCQRWH